VDYNEEIPFEKKPPPGFHNTSEDADYVASHNFRRLRHQDVIGNSRDAIEKVRISGALGFCPYCVLICLVVVFFSISRL